MSDTSPRLYSAVIKTAERLRQEADSVVIEAAGLTVAQAALLGVVLRDPDATQSDIAVRLELSEPAVTQMVARLQREGLIERTRDASDRRRWRLKVSEEGVEKADRAKSAFDSVNARLEKMMGEAVAHDVAANIDVTGDWSDLRPLQFEAPCGMTGQPPSGTTATESCRPFVAISNVRGALSNTVSSESFLFCGSAITTSLTLTLSTGSLLA